MIKNKLKPILIALLCLFFIVIFYSSGIPATYLVDFATAIALILGTALLYGIRYQRCMDIVKKRDMILSSLWYVTFVTFFIGIMGVLTQAEEMRTAFLGFAVTLITVPYAAVLWGLIELYCMYWASREVDVYSDTPDLDGVKNEPILDPIERERVLLKQKYSLTPRETEIVGELLKGKTNREIAEALYISEMTVKKHMANIFSKVGVSNRQALTILLHQKN